MNVPSSSNFSGAPPYQPYRWNSINNLKHTHNCYAYMLNDLLSKTRKHGKPQPGYHANHIGKLQRNMTMSNTERISCSEVKRGVKMDSPNIKELSLKSGRNHVCDDNHYKGFLMVSPGGDYHFAREDNRLIPVYRSLHKDSKNLIPAYRKTRLQIAQSFLNKTHLKAPSVIKTASYTYPSLMQKDAISQMRAILMCSRLWSHKPGQTSVTDRDASRNLIVNPEDADWNYSKVGGINYNKSCCYFEIPKNCFKETHSTGIPSLGMKKNSISNLSPNLSAKESIDAKYERLIRTVCRV